MLFKSLMIWKLQTMKNCQHVIVLVVCFLILVLVVCALNLCAPTIKWLRCVQGDVVPHSIFCTVCCNLGNISKMGCSNSATSQFQQHVGNVAYFKNVLVTLKLCRSSFTQRDKDYITLQVKQRYC